MSRYGHRYLELTGKRFGIVTVLKYAYSKHDQTYWLCRCDCGKEKTIISPNLRKYPNISCGCIKEKTKIKYNEDNAALRCLYSNYKSRARRFDRVFNISIEDFKRLIGQKCRYCGDEPHMVCYSRSKKTEYVYNSLDRIDSLKGYEINNVVPCCGICNSMKMDMTTESFLEHIRKISNHGL